jgi:hypothetical protein
MVEKKEPLLEGLRKGADKTRPEEERPQTSPPGQGSQGNQEDKGEGEKK